MLCHSYKPPSFIGRTLFTWWVALISTAYSMNLCADNLILQVTADGKPLSNAMIKAMPLMGEREKYQLIANSEKNSVEIEVVNNEYVPQIMGITQGSTIFFTNRDEISHHLYSFSKAKPFDLLLMKQDLPEPFVFDTAGVVVLGCNIHEKSLGYIYVSDTPYYVKTDQAGKALLTNMPSGPYDVSVWHPATLAPKKSFERVVLEGGDVTLDFTLELKPQRVWQPFTVDTNTTAATSQLRTSDTNNLVRTVDE